MGKKGKQNVGRAVLKNRSRGGNLRNAKESWLHTSELNDGEELNVKSVTEQSSLDEFLTTAELAGTEFVAEKLNISVYNVNHTGGLPSKQEEKRIQEIQEQHRQLLQIPRRPPWNATTTADQLDQLEKENFLAWRRNLAEVQKKDDLILTPFERNLEFWRQLWRVIERSDVVVQIVDARNPLLFRCEDLEQYVREVKTSKINILLINKADFLTQEQRESWAIYFKSIHVKAVFWSAIYETERLKKMNSLKDDESCIEAVSDEEKTYEDCHSDNGSTLFHNLQLQKDINDTNTEDLSSDDGTENIDSNHGKSLNHNDVIESSKLMSNENVKISSSSSDIREEIINDHCDSDCVFVAGKNIEFYTSGHLLTGDELLAYCQWIHDGRGQDGVIKDSKERQTVIGLVGYPNVGKSSTINAILQSKKVPVSSTPGRTKHFQTHLVDKTICLCDCPGLVFPSFVSTKAEMVVSGILPIDQLRDHVPPVSLVCRRIPRNVFHTVYGINLREPEEWEDMQRSVDVEELLDAYSHSRGFITRQARSDAPRSARYILKDYVNGKLLYCHPPPGIDDVDFQISFTSVVKTVKKRPFMTGKKYENKTDSSNIDRDFFRQSEVKSHTTAVTGTEEYRRLMQADPNIVMVGKPWKKHGNRNKKEKLRRLKPNQY